MAELVKRNKAMSVSPLKASQPVGGALAFLGLWGTALAVDYGFVTGLIKGKAVLWLLAQLLLCVLCGTFKNEIDHCSLSSPFHISSGLPIVR